jgi:hypothetical protein
MRARLEQVVIDLSIMLFVAPSAGISQSAAMQSLTLGRRGDVMTNESDLTTDRPAPGLYFFATVEQTGCVSLRLNPTEQTG